MLKKPTVTVAICAYNEEKNISLLLESILRQKECTYKLKKILVISDGSTDDTVINAKKFRSTKLFVQDFKERRGKSLRLNEIFKQLQTELLVLFDADVILSGNKTIENLIEAITDPEVGLAGGNPIPLQGRNLIEKSINTSTHIYRKLRKMGLVAYGCDGRVMALSAKFAKSVYVPNDMIANDAFLYFSALTKNFKAKHVSSAIVYYRSPQTIRDQIRQNTRFIAAHYRLERTFGDIVKKEYRMPKGFYFKETLKEFLKHPVEAGFLFLINLICRFKAKKQERDLTALWSIAQTTKNLS